MRSFVVVLLVVMAWALSGCGWLRPLQQLSQGESLSPQSRQTVVLEYFRFNVDDIPGLKERLVQAIRQELKELYGREPLEVRIGFPQGLQRTLHTVVSSPRRDQTSKVFEEHMGQIVAKIRSAAPLARAVTTADPIEFCQAYRALDKQVEKVASREGVLFRVSGVSDWPSLLYSCYHLSSSEEVPR